MGGRGGGGGKHERMCPTVVFQAVQDVEIEECALMSGRGGSARIANRNISVTVVIFVDQMTSLCKFKHLGCAHEESHDGVSSKQFLLVAVWRRSLFLNSQYL